MAASSYHKVLEENRLLHNQVQDLKGEFFQISYILNLCMEMGLIQLNVLSTGTIRVYCRVRPFLSRQSNERSTVDYIGENGNIMIVNPQKQGKEARKVFTFNKVFGTNVTQRMSFSQLIFF